MKIIQFSRVISTSFLVSFLLVSLISPLLADAKTDGERGIEEYRNGNLIEGMQLLEKSAEAGYAPAQATLAYILDQSERDEQAFHWFQQAADNNNADGLFGLGSMYAKGEGTEPDPEKAGQLTKQAAMLNHLVAMRAYANALEFGQLGFDPDSSAAVEWYLNAANAGDKVSMQRLKDAYTLGQLGLAVDLEQAGIWDSKINAQQ